MAARQVQHTFQTQEARDLLQRLSDFEDEVRNHYQAQPPAQPLAYNFDDARLLSAVTYITGEGAAPGAQVVPAADRTRVGDDLIRILRTFVAYESFDAADHALVGLPRVVAQLPAARAEEWAQIGVGTKTIADVFAQHQALQPTLHGSDTASYFGLAPQSDGVAVFAALGQMTVQQQGQGQQNLQTLGWGAQLRALVPRPRTRGERIATYAGLGTLVLAAAIGFSSYQGWGCGPSPAPVSHADAGVHPNLDAGSDGAGYSAPLDGSASAQSQRRDASASPAPPVAATRADGGAPSAASAGALSSPPPRLDGGAPAQPAAPVAPVAPVVPAPAAPVPPVAPIAPATPGTPYIAQTPSPRMDGGVPAAASPAAPYVAAPAAPVVPAAPVAPTAPAVPPVVPAPAVVCPPAPVCPAPTDFLATMLGDARQYVANHSWQEIVGAYARVPVAVSIRSYKGNDARGACELGIGQLVDLTLGSVPGAQTHSLYGPLRADIIAKGVDACAAHVQVGRDKDIRFGLGLDKL